MQVSVFTCLSAVLLTLPWSQQHVVDKFSDIKECEEFFVNKTPPDIDGILKAGNVQDQNRYKVVCQLYKNNYRFATLYDTANRIPVFSAYKFIGQGKTTRKADPWFIEPQLDGATNKAMDTEKTVQDEGKTPGVKQAINEYYKGQSPCIYHRGHLFPRQHTIDQDTADSTFTLTNAVPQYNIFNSVNWCRMESKVIQMVKENCVSEAYMVTGVVAGSSKLDNKINIPAIMWTAFCCKDKKKNQMVSQAHYGDNVDKAEVSAVTLNKLQEHLKSKNFNIDVFRKQCVGTTTLEVNKENDSVSNNNDFCQDDGCPPNKKQKN